MFTCVPLSITPVNGWVPDRSQVAHRNRGWLTRPEPLMVPRLYGTFFRASRRVPSTRMLFWLSRNAGVPYG